MESSRELSHTAGARAQEHAHTPGPWDLCDLGDYGDFDGNSRVILDAGNTMRIAVVHSYGEPEDEANATLIAAAPDLLAALFACAEQLRALKRPGRPGDSVSRALDASRAAIARATLPQPHEPQGGEA